MNVGLLVGQVLARDGRPAVGAEVALKRVTGDAGDIQIWDWDGKRPPVYGKSGKNGVFRIKYQWSGTEIAEVMTPPFLTVVAWTEKNWTTGRIQYSQVTASRASHTRGFLVKNVLELTQQGISTFKARDDIQDFAEQFAKLQIGMLTTESWILASGLYMYLE